MCYTFQLNKKIAFLTFQEKKMNASYKKENFTYITCESTGFNMITNQSHLNINSIWGKNVCIEDSQI